MLMKYCLRFSFILLFFQFQATTSSAQQHALKNYQQQFYIIDSLAKTAHPKEALILIHRLNSQARKEGNNSILLKTAIYRIMLQNYLEKDGVGEIIVNLKQDIKIAKQPEKSILQSLLAETY